LFDWACRAAPVHEILAALVGPAQNIFSSARHYVNTFVTFAQQAGQAAELGRLCMYVSMYMCLWLCQTTSHPNGLFDPLRNNWFNLPGMLAAADRGEEV
jgi:hypothetical protein